MTNSFLSDKELYQKCLELSGLIKKYRNQFIALLPEVESRKLYLKYGMHSVYEFASKLAGLNHDTVRRVLKLDLSLRCHAKLDKLFKSGDVGWSKLEVAKKLIGAVDETKLVKILPTISKQALIVMAKDLCIQNVDKAGVEFEDTREVFSVKVSGELLAQMRVLKLNLEKQKKQPLSWEKTLEMMVHKFKESQGEVKQKTDELAEVGLAQPDIDAAVSSKKVPPAKQKPASRYIPASKKRQILAKFKQLCSKCNRPAVHLHHQIPFAVSKNHESLVPLCRAHHDAVHHSEQTKVNLSYRKHKRLAMRL